MSINYIPNAVKDYTPQILAKGWRGITPRLFPHSGVCQIPFVWIVINSVSKITIAIFISTLMIFLQELRVRML